MSPRLKVYRKVLTPPIIKGFKPYGHKAENNKHKPINLLFEEYEAIRLCDYEMLNHQKSSLLMGVSRPTFTRIYASALRKIATAFVKGTQISIEGGKVYFDSNWYQCNACDCKFNNPEMDKSIENCPLCGSQEIMENEEQKDSIDEIDDLEQCICLKCGFEQDHVRGHACNKQSCPKCNNKMTRKSNIE